MMHYSVQPRDQIFVKGYQFLSFHGNMGRNISKNINKYLSSKYSQKRIDHAKQSVEIHWKNQLMIYRMMIYRITKISKTSPGNNSVKNTEHDSEVHRERYISPEQRQSYWWSRINIII